MFYNIYILKKEKHKMFLYRLYFQISEIYEANRNTYLKQIFFIFSEVT